ncbi:hypothetical protein F4824DRAFT_503187 [Ustulina deusta]|nr:hypothetical protein F4823DRAFT_566277 [Ustulina deusta]KAI3333416.1 hypothetical protein F4824DRAFT_503187 [Ustulina deusta]
MDSTLEDKVTSTVQAIIEIAVELGSSLAVLEKNTREIFWWTSWATTVVLGIFILRLLVKVSAQLGKLNTYQDVFHRMWVEDRASDEKDRNERRERYNLATRSAAATPRERTGATAAAAQAQPRLEDYLYELGEFGESEGSLPAEGTQDYEEFLHGLRAEIRRRRVEN